MDITLKNLTNLSPGIFFALIGCARGERTASHAC